MRSGGAISIVNANCDMACLQDGDCRGKRWVKRLNCAICKKYRCTRSGSVEEETTVSDGSLGLICFTRATSVTTPTAINTSMQCPYCRGRKQRLEESASSFAPIAASLNTLRGEESGTLCRKFDVAFFLAKESFHFTNIQLFAN